MSSGNLDRQLVAGDFRAWDHFATQGAKWIARSYIQYIGATGPWGESFSYSESKSGIGTALGSGTASNWSAGYGRKKSMDRAAGASSQAP